MSNSQPGINLTITTTLIFFGIAVGIVLAITEFRLVQRINANTPVVDQSQPVTQDPTGDPAAIGRTASHPTASHPTIGHPDKIITYDPGVHIFPAKEFPQRLAEFIDQNHQTIVITVCPLATAKNPDAGYLVLTRPDPDWLKILPGTTPK